MMNGKRSVFSLKGPVRGATIACDSGAVWITQAGDIRDYVIVAGMDFTVPGEGSVAIQLMEHAGITIRLPDREPGRLRRLLTKCRLARAADSRRRRPRLFPARGGRGCCAPPGWNRVAGGGGS